MRARITAVLLAVFAFGAGLGGLPAGPGRAEESEATEVDLPPPERDGGTSVERALALRRSARDLSDRPLELKEVAQLCWAAQGITSDRGFRTAPSAGALYPLTVYVAAGRVEGLPPGVYRYRPSNHSLARVSSGDARSRFREAALDQESIGGGAAVLAVTGTVSRTARKYGARAERYVQIEAGCAAANVGLQCAALDLGSVVVGAFRDDAVRGLLGAGEGETPLVLMPVGRKR
jgi:SagB-type dehydrogenase family enzyme